MRRVKYKCQIFVPTDGQKGSHYEIENGEGYFHCWGCGYNELDVGAGNFTTGIVELDNGIIRNVPAENIQFIDEVKI